MQNTSRFEYPPTPPHRLTSERKMCHPHALLQVASFMSKSFTGINIKTDFMTKKSLMLKQTQPPSNTWRWKSLLWHTLYYELWMINQKESILLQFSLPLVTTEFIDTKSVSREPGGYKCKTAIWDIHNLCAFDVVICKKLQRNFNGLEAEKRGEKNLWGGCLAIFFL